jgi:hypothetical protein
LQPKGRHAIEVAVAVAVDEVHPLGIRDDQRLVVEPELHVRERVPDVPLVELAQPVCVVVGVDIDREAYERRDRPAIGPVINNFAVSHAHRRIDAIRFRIHISREG